MGTSHLRLFVTIAAAVAVGVLIAIAATAGFLSWRSSVATSENAPPPELPTYTIPVPTSNNQAIGASELDAATPSILTCLSSATLSDCLTASGRMIFQGEGTYETDYEAAYKAIDALPVSNLPFCQPLPNSPCNHPPLAVARQTLRAAVDRLRADYGLGPLPAS